MHRRDVEHDPRASKSQLHEDPYVRGGHVGSYICEKKELPARLTDG